jgi:hypothetical protein
LNYKTITNSPENLIDKYQKGRNDYEKSILESQPPPVCPFLINRSGCEQKEVYANTEESG